MAQRRVRYRKKPFAVYEHGTRIYAPTKGEDCYRVSVTDATGKRLSFKFTREDDARTNARELEAYLSSRTPIYGVNSGDRTVGVLSSRYMEHLASKSLRYRERQDWLLRSWILPELRDTSVAEWTPAMSEDVLGTARQKLAPQTVQGLGSCMRSLVTFAHKSRWLPRQVDPMWSVSYSAKAEFQGQAPGFVPRESLPNDEDCATMFAGFDRAALAVHDLAVAAGLLDVEDQSVLDNDVNIFVEDVAVEQPNRRKVSRPDIADRRYQSTSEDCPRPRAPWPPEVRVST